MQELQFDFTAPFSAADLYERLFFADNTILLESKDPLSKQNRQSLIGAHCALKITQKDLSLTLEALNANGLTLLEKAEAKFGGLREDLTLKLDYERNEDIFDEEERLKAPHPVEVISFLQTGLKSLPQVFMAGSIGFDYINTYEKVKGFSKLDKSKTPDLILLFFEVTLVFDHLKGKSYVVVDDFSADNAHLGRLATCAQKLIEKIAKAQPLAPLAEIKNPNLEDLKALGLKADFDDEDFSNKIRELKENILAGEVFQVVPARSFYLPLKKPLLAYRYLSAKNPSPYMFFIKTSELELFGTSPEFALRFEAQDRSLYISPIAGTRPRPLNRDGSLNEAVDKRVELELRTNQKELSEHIMLVDLARNDLARIAKAGTVSVENLLYVVKYQHVMHLVSDVKAKLRDDLDALRAYLSVMNMGTLSGAPKIKAHELIYKTEGKRRNFYGGTMVRLSSDGSFDSCIVIRSALVSGEQARVQAGCGITKDSRESDECAETLFKAFAVLSAIYKANQF